MRTIQNGFTKVHHYNYHIHGTELASYGHVATGRQAPRWEVLREIDIASGRQTLPVTTADMQDRDPRKVRSSVHLRRWCRLGRLPGARRG